MKKKAIVLAAITALIVTGSIARACEKVATCHATSSASNPFNLISVDMNATVQGHDGHSGDIIPIFNYTVTVTEKVKVPNANGHGTHWEDVTTTTDYTYPGKNLGTLYGDGFTGAEVLANGCVIPTRPEPEPSVTPEPDPSPSPSVSPGPSPEPSPSPSPSPEPSLEPRPEPSVTPTIIEEGSIPEDVEQLG